MDPLEDELAALQVMDKVIKSGVRKCSFGLYCTQGFYSSNSLKLDLVDTPETASYLGQLPESNWSSVCEADSEMQVLLVLCGLDFQLADGECHSHARWEWVLACRS